MQKKCVEYKSGSSLHFFVNSDGPGGYESKTRMGTSSGDFIVLDNIPVIKPCMEIVCAGTDMQGAAVEFISLSNILLNVFEMKNPNLEEPADGIKVTVRTTG